MATQSKRANASEGDSVLAPPDVFAHRHIGPRGDEAKRMLEALGVSSLDELVDRTVPRAIRSKRALDLPAPRTEREVLEELQELASRNQIFRSYLGLGYHDCVTPSVIRRTVLENPGWYTQYTPYQAEIAQGRLEALLNFQTMVADLTGMEVANASLLDEATAAAEGMTFCHRLWEGDEENPAFLVSDRCHPQVIAVVRTRAEALGIPVVVGRPEDHDFSLPAFGALLAYPATDGEVVDHAPFVARAHAAGCLVVVAADLLALALLRPPGEIGADAVLGSTQRFGVPLGYGGPHAAYFATRERYKRQIPGRIVGVSKDAEGSPAIRLALQTREQHIRRERATSNICTAQVLLAVIASFYGVYHGPDGLRRIAARIHAHATLLARALERLGYAPRARVFFDTLRVAPGPRSQTAILAAARDLGINLRAYEGGDVGIALDETVSPEDLGDVVRAFGGSDREARFEAMEEGGSAIPAPHVRTSGYLTHPVFHAYRSETEFLRYVKRLESRDLSLTTSMIPLGSCTMKLNAAAEMFPISFPGFALLHPFAPPEQAKGYADLFERLSRWLAEITGFDAASLMPNAGAQGEYAGLLVIRAYHRSRGDEDRNICLIPVSAHGTNPASAVLAGMKVVGVACDAQGNIEIEDLRARAFEHRADLAALMVTYPSTHGVFEEGIREICDIVHQAGGQVYLDGANMNALIGLARPGEFGADVCHLNLHKTFCIPHGGGGPGMGPICVAAHLAPFLPRHPLVPTGGEAGIGAVSAAPWGSPSILPISYAYVAMMGAAGLTRATEVAILNANYVARRLDPHYPLLYRGRSGLVAHECIVDLRPLKAAGIEVEDVAKRLVDYGFHAPTMSWPVPGTLMIEPTESEGLAELDRFCDAMIAIREEVREIEDGRADRASNLLKNAPHTATVVCADAWDRPYSRERAAFPEPRLRAHKFWPAVARIDNAYGDRNLVCSCLPVEAYTG
jgi:glycine dehydrogenase